MQDEKLICAIKNHRESAMQEVIPTYARLLWKVAGSVLYPLGTAQDVEECVADTFVFLWEHPEKYDPKRGKLKTWLAIVCRSRAIDRCRELRKWDTVSLSDTMLAEELDMEENFLNQRVSEILEMEIEALGEPAREILLRRYYEGQKPKEIAQSLRISRKQVENYLYRSRQKLKDRITAVIGGANGTIS